MTIRLGVIADDFTGATDVAGMLVEAGVPTVQTVGVPAALPEDAQAVVIALKSRTAPRDQAVAQALAAAQMLRAAGVPQVYFKVCSTFDSTQDGNIGPVAEALAALLGAGCIATCPALPVAGRSLYQGHLFVLGRLLSESSMRDHPLTPMRDPDLVRVLAAQSKAPVGLVDWTTVRAGAEAIRQRLARLEAEGCGQAIVDALDDQDLGAIAQALVDVPLLTAGSGVARALPAAWQATQGWQPDPQAGRLEGLQGRAAVLAGSCSQATLAQIERWRADGRPLRALDPLELAAGPRAEAEALAWALGQQQTPLLHASASPQAVQAAQQALGREAAGALVEATLGRLARALRAQGGVQRLIVAGGETSGAVVQALGVERLRIGRAIVPGVPWTEALLADGQPLGLALKSGNFGGPDFFARALEAAA